MKMQLKISGMKCAHCQAACEEALNAIDGVEAKADFKKGIADVKAGSDVSEEALKAAVAGAGFQVDEIKEKKGLFSK